MAGEVLQESLRAKVACLVAEVAQKNVQKAEAISQEQAPVIAVEEQGLRRIVTEQYSCRGRRDTHLARSRALEEEDLRAWVFHRRYRPTLCPPGEDPQASLYRHHLLQSMNCEYRRKEECTIGRTGFLCFAARLIWEKSWVTLR